MPKRPWYPKNPGDYSRKTKHLTLEEHGAYNLLIDYYWDNPKLPSDEATLHRLLHKIWGISLQKTKKIWKVLSIFFQKNNEFFVHERIERELEKSERIQKVKSEAGKRGNAKRWSHMPSQTDRMSQPQPHSKKTIAKKDACTGFENWWQNYPRKVNKKRALEIWQAHGLEAKSETLLAALQNQITNEPQWREAKYIPHPTTYLNGERWNDEISERTGEELSAFESADAALREWAAEGNDSEVLGEHEPDVSGGVVIDMRKGA